MSSEKSQYAHEIAKADDEFDAAPAPPQPAPETPQRSIRRKVSRAFSSLSLRSRAQKDALRAAPPPLPSPPASVESTSSSESYSPRRQVQKERVVVPYTPAYPLVRIDPVLIGCFVCL